MNYILQTNSLTKKYKNFQALNGLTMNVPKGSIYGFVGKNGAGKTTLIRLICGLQEPTSGSFSLYGIRNDSKDIIKSRRRMGAVVETPSIYMDMTAEENLKHQYLILGSTLTEIAGEKAGILKSGVPVICDGSEPEAMAVIRKRAAILHCPLKVIEPEQVKILLNRGKNIDFLLQDRYDNKSYRIHVQTEAVYQTMNGSLAWMAVKELQKQDSELQQTEDGVFLEGMAHMHWPGRLEELLPGVYVDGAHNVGGIRKLRESIAASFAGRPVWLLFAVASDKDYGEMIRILCTIPELKGVTVTEIENYRRTDLETVASIFRKNWHGYVGHSYNINEAITTSEQQAAKYPNAVLICAGSLYLAGSVIEALQR